MLAVATFVFLYYTIWTLLMVRRTPSSLSFHSFTMSRCRPEFQLTLLVKPFVDEDHALHSLFPPRVWAIRIPVILILLGSAVVGSFLGVVMIRSNKKKAAKLKAAKSK